MPLKSKFLSMEEVAKIVLDAGATGDLAVTVLAVIWGESGGNVYAVNGPIETDSPDDPAYLSLDRGLAQWNSGWWPVKDKDAFDPNTAVKLMVDHVKNGTRSAAVELSIWTAFKNLSFVRHVPAATKAVAAVGG